LGWVPTGAKNYCTAHCNLQTVFSNVNTHTSGYTTKGDRKKRNFNTLVMQKAQEPVQNTLMIPEKMSDFQTM